MTEMAVIVPTRGRPQNIRRLMESWVATKATATLWLGVDADDETFDMKMVNGLIEEFGIDVKISQDERTTMCGTLNALALRASVEYKFVGFMGDDHCPRTTKWDHAICQELMDTGIVYGNDLMQGALLPTAVFMTSDIIRTLGYMAPKTFTHLHLDTVWKVWGEKLERLTYLPDVVIEHMHPQAGKADWDEGHIRVNAGDMWERDNAAYADYVDYGHLDRDVQKLMALL